MGLAAIDGPTRQLDAGGRLMGLPTAIDGPIGNSTRAVA